MVIKPIWDFFTKADTDASKAQCLQCCKLFSLGSDKPKLQTTTGLKGHLASCHKDANATYMKRVKSQDEERSAKKVKVDESAEKNVLPNFTQISLKAMTEIGNFWPDDHNVAQRIDKCITDLILVDMLPYSVIEGDAFKRLNFADPLGARRYKLKTEKYFRRTMMRTTAYEKVVQYVKFLLTKAEWVSFSTEGWSNPTKSCSLLSFTGHFVHEAVRHKVILSAMVLKEDHTAAGVTQRGFCVATRACHVRLLTY